MEAWHDFWVALVGASAALAGLLFVSISINLEKIIASSKLVDRAAVPLILLLAILIAGLLILVPNESVPLLGIEILIGGVVVWLFVSYLDFQRLRAMPEIVWRAEAGRIVLSQLSSLPYIVAGIVLLTGNPNGINWLVPAVITSFIKSFVDAWVLLIEINR